MIRAIPSFGWALAALLTLSGTASVATAGTDQVPSGSRDGFSAPGASPDLSIDLGSDERSVRVLVADVAGVVAGIRLQPVGGGQDRRDHNQQKQRVSHLAQFGFLPLVLLPP